MHFGHSSQIWADYPELVAGALFVQGIAKEVSVNRQVTRFNMIAESRLATKAEGELPEIQAWRRVFSRMGLKPTQYRCASEALLRRFKKEKTLPQIHPLIDICNAVSLAFAIPIAVFDVAKIAEFVEVRYATGAEVYLTFSGETENPQTGEVIFADNSGNAHARRWTNRQSAYSAIRHSTNEVLIVAEAMHESAGTDIRTLTARIAEEIEAVWFTAPQAKILSRPFARFEF
jgi:DNA/RNA-binding domain of Phe-tRNA-synthetase-like protein